MEIGIALAVLAASLLHATWHALVKASGDRLVALAGMNLVSGAMALVLVPFVRPPALIALAVIAGSVLLHASYKVALSRLYARSELSRGYPLARGVTPVIASALALLTIGEKPNGVALVGIACLACGIAGLVLENGVRAMRVATLASAVAAGACVAAYSVLDAYGVRINGDWVGFTVWLVACDSLVFVGFVIVTRGRQASSAWKGQWRSTLVSGMLGVASFSVFLWALSRAQVGPVTALRETSVLFAAIIGAAFLNERMTIIRLIAACMVAAGTAALSLSG